MPGSTQVAEPVPPAPWLMRWRAAKCLDHPVSPGQWLVRRRAAKCLDHRCPQVRGKGGGGPLRAGIHPSRGTGAAQSVATAMGAAAFHDPPKSRNRCRPVRGKGGKGPPRGGNHPSRGTGAAQSVAKAEKGRRVAGTTQVAEPVSPAPWQRRWRAAACRDPPKSRNRCHHVRGKGGGGPLRAWPVFASVRVVPCRGERGTDPGPHRVSHGPGDTGPAGGGEGGSRHAAALHRVCHGPVDLVDHGTQRPSAASATDLGTPVPRACNGPHHLRHDPPK